MHTVAFQPDDKLLRFVVEARDATHGLRVQVHYASCGHWAGEARCWLPYWASKKVDN
jgi:hypothetical protein